MGIKHNLWTCHWALEQSEETLSPHVRTLQSVAGLQPPLTPSFTLMCVTKATAVKVALASLQRACERSKLTRSWFDNLGAELVASAEYQEKSSVLHDKVEMQHCGPVQSTSTQSKTQGLERREESVFQIKVAFSLYSLMIMFKGHLGGLCLSSRKRYLCYSGYCPRDRPLCFRRA